MASLVERNEAGLVDAGRSRGQPRRRGHDDEPRLSACPARLRMRGLCGRGGTQALSQVPSSRASFWRDSEQSRNTQPVSRQRGSSHEHGEVARASDGSGRRGGLRAARRHPCGLPGCLRGREERERHHAAWTERRFADGDPSGRHDLRDPFLEDGRGRDVPVLDGGGGGVQSNEDTFSTTGGTSHSTAVGGLEDGSSFTFYVRCQDLSRNANRDDYPIRFSVQSGDDCGTPSANAYGAWTPAVGASDRSSSGPVGTWTFVPSPKVESASPSIIVDNSLQGIEAIAPDDVWTVGYANNPNGPQYSIQTLALHWDGSAWSTVATPNAPTARSRVYGGSAA